MRRGAALPGVAALLAGTALACLDSAEAGPRVCRDCELPWAWEDAEPQPPPAPLPQGFALTVAVAPGLASGAEAPKSLSRYPEVAARLGRCWSERLHPDDARWRDLTLRVSFTREGIVNGIPRIVHVSEPADDAASRRARLSLLAALGGCTPLRFAPSLGEAIAGQIFAIRFTQQRTS